MKIIVHQILGICIDKGLGVVGIVALHHVAVEIQQPLRICRIPLAFPARHGTKNEIFVVRYRRRAEGSAKPEVSILACQRDVNVVRTPALTGRRVACLVVGVTDLNPLNGSNPALHPFFGAIQKRQYASVQIHHFFILSSVMDFKYIVSYATWEVKRLCHTETDLGQKKGL